MKTYFKYIIVLLIASVSSCTDVIDVDVPEAAPRLVIEASLDWEKGTLGNDQTIKLSLSTPYFNSNIDNFVIGASVKVTNDLDATEFVFMDQNDGNYKVNNFIPVIGQSYTLEVIYDGEIYLAQETMTSVVYIAEINQSVEDGFNDEALEVNVLFDDPADIDNFYLFRLQEQGDLLVELFDVSDEFTDGNQIKVFYEKEDDEDIDQEEFEAGDVVSIDFHGISEPYYNYIRLLIEQYGSVGDPFSATPVALRGNCTNTSDSDNYAFGYFRLTEVVKTSYTFQ
ncbi:hypothetical protein A9Q87_11875 [Flavobacteriales bacterium 34_180_T64]|mgnify:CR=1 FL=1|nr:hypothetical protein A9Q87_11875 [Flavobacteriales bacterium 34_180_T64]